MDIPIELSTPAPAYQPVQLRLTVGVGFQWLAALANLAVRLWVASVFFKSGLVKIQSWDSTLSLFAYEYHVPYLDPELAAYLGTGAELLLPVFLVLGLGGRLSAMALFLFNIVAVISYPDLNAAGLEQHRIWGLMLLVIIGYGVDRLSLDYLWSRWLKRA